MPLAMEREARRRHTGEEAWTNMGIDGIECVSSGCQVIGCFVGYCGYNASSSTITPSRKGQFHNLWDDTQLPAMMRSKFP